MKNLKKLIAIAVASSMVMSTTVFAKTTTANKTANYQKADTTYGENFDSAIAATKLPTSATSIITTLYSKYGMNQTQEDTIIRVVNNLIAKADTIKATATANGTATPSYYDIATKDSTFNAYATIQAQSITGVYGLAAGPTATGADLYDSNGNLVMSVDKSQFKQEDFQNVSRDKATLLAQLKTALDAAVAATANGTTTEMPVATPTTTAPSTATTGAATGTTATTTSTETVATGTTTGGNTNPGAGAGTGGDVATGITYGQALDNAIAATKLPASVTSIITTLYSKYGMTQVQENTILTVVNNLIAKADSIKASATANGTATPSYYDIATKDSTFNAYATIQAQSITGVYGLAAGPTATGADLYDSNGNLVMSVDKSQFKKEDFQNVSRDKATLLAQLKTALDAAVAASTYGSTTVIPTSTATATNPATTTEPGTTTATTTPATTTEPGTTTATTTPATTTEPGTTTATTTPATTTEPGTTTATTTPGTATATGTTTAPTPVQDLANTLTNLGVQANLVTTITNALNILPTEVQNKVANIVNTFLKSARSATDLAAAKAAIDADTTLTAEQKTLAKAALDQAAILAPATTTPATGTATGTATPTPDTSAILQLVTTIGNNAQDALNALGTLFAKDPVAANALSAKINAYLGSQTQANYDAALAAINSADLTQAEKDALIKIIGARPAVDAATGTATSTTAGGSTNASGTTPSVLPKTATEAANMAVAGLAMITIAGTVFFISKKRMA